MDVQGRYRCSHIAHDLIHFYIILHELIRAIHIYYLDMMLIFDQVQPTQRFLCR